jgi:hypothetical protein
VKPVEEDSVRKNEMERQDDVARLTAAEEDPLLHRHLADLPSFGPNRLFDEHVLSRVWRPDPEWVENVRRAGQELFQTGRGWFLIGGLALGSLLPLMVLVAAGVTFDGEIGRGLAWLFDRGLPTAWKGVSGQFTELLSQGETRLRALPFSGGTLRTFAGGSFVLLAGCAWGLRCTMRPSGVRR